MDLSHRCKPLFSYLQSVYRKSCTLVNSDDQGKMPQNAAFCQGLYCLRRQIKLCYLENLTCVTPTYL